MDSLITMVTGVINHNTSLINLIIFIIGFFIPALIGMVLPRQKTIGYGRIIYRLFGTMLAQKRLHMMPDNIWQTFLTLVRSTFVDMSYGVYIESRVDLSKEEKEKKIQEYLDLTHIKPEAPADQTKVEAPAEQPKVEAPVESKG
jgi:hypothetical protein